MVMPRHHQQQGFSLVELMLVTAVLGILGSFAAPNLQQWGRNYQLRSAVTTLHSHMHLAKLGAIKENRPWTIQFNPAGYQVRNGAGQPVKTVTFGAGQYESIKYANPTSTTLYDVDILTFNHNGLSNTGYAYLSNTRNSGYYRIGLPYSTGFLKTEKWTGSTWN